MTTLEAVSRLLRLIKPYKKIFTVAMLALAGASAINLLIPQIIRLLLDAKYSVYLTESPGWVGSILVGLFVAQAICLYYRSFFFGLIGQKVVADIRKSLYRSISNQNVEFFDKERVGDLVSRLSSDTLLIQDAVSIKLSVFIRYSLQVVVGIILMSLLSLQLTLTLMVLLPILVAFAIMLGRKLRRYSRLQQEELGHSSRIAEETFSGARVVKAFGRETFEHQRYSRAAEKVLEAGINRSRTSAFMQSFISLLMNTSIVVVLLLGITLVASQGLSAGDLTAFLLYGVIVAISFAFLASGYSDFLQAIGGSERVFELLSKEEPPQSVENADQKQPQTLSSDIKFNNVSFHYPTRPEVPVLKNISFSIPAGKSTALIGPSGAGKSTIVNLLLRFYEPGAGNISCGSTEFGQIRIDLLRNQIAIVPQDPHLFGVSIRENILYGKPDASEDELRQACSKARILDFIESLPESFDTNTGDRGIQLSGGQKQRVAIARAILRKPKLFILDEATSALDSESEHAIQEALEAVMSDTTTLIIAHRLSTVKRSQQVIVLDKGVAVQQGSHQELSQQEGLYKQLVQKQNLYSLEEQSSRIKMA